MSFIYVKKHYLINVILFFCYIKIQYFMEHFSRSVDSSGGQSLQITVNVWDQIAHNVTLTSRGLNTETCLPVVAHCVLPLQVYSIQPMWMNAAAVCWYFAPRTAIAYMLSFLKNKQT